MARKLWFGLLVFAGCGNCREQPPKAAIPTLERAITDLEAAPDEWFDRLAVLQKELYVQNQIPLSEAVNALATRSGTPEGPRGPCPATFVGKRVQAALANLRDSTLGKTNPEPKPLVCASTLKALLPGQPGASAIQFSGSDFDRAPLRITTNSTLTPSLEAKLVVHSHQSASLDLGAQPPPPWVTQLELKAGEQTLATVALVTQKNPVWTTIALRSGAEDSHPQVRVEAPADTTLVGGGCRTHWKREGQVLLATHPTPDGKAWVCSSKDHGRPEPSSIDGFAITVPASTGIQTRVFSSTGESANHPRAEVTVPEGWTVISGGCATDFGDGLGSLLTVSERRGNGWACQAKDHFGASPATVTAHALAIENRSDIEVLYTTGTSEVAHHPELHLPIALGDQLLVGGGCRTDFSGAGNLLWAAHPSPEGDRWICGGKDHRAPDRAKVAGESISLRFK